MLEMSSCAIFPAFEPAPRKDIDRQCFNIMGRKCWWYEGGVCWLDTATNVNFPRRDRARDYGGFAAPISWHTLYTCEQERWRYVSSFLDIPVDSFWIGERSDVSGKPDDLNCDLEMDEEVIDGED